MIRYIYIVQCNNYIKIGKARNPQSRLKQIQCHNPYTLELLYSKQLMNTDKLELQCHKHFNDNKIRGEWFDITVLDNVIEYIETLGVDNI